MSEQHLSCETDPLYLYPPKRIGLLDTVTNILALSEPVTEDLCCFFNAEPRGSRGQADY